MFIVGYRGSMNKRSTTSGISLIHPFGEVSFEDEIQLFPRVYEQLYFNETPFNEESLDTDRYLIVGRRGTGKSSLAQYFTFQKKIKKARCIDVDHPDIYDTVLSEFSRKTAQHLGVAIPRIVKMWELVVWSLIFEELKESDSAISAACYFTQRKSSAARMTLDIIKGLITRFTSTETGEIGTGFEDFVSSDVIENAKKATLKISGRNPVILAIDALERCSIDDEQMMRATAALVQAAKQINHSYAIKGIHIKVFISAEIFPYLSENIISNYSKYVRKPIYMHWRTRDLMRLVCWRFFHYLKARDQLKKESKCDIDWTNFESVYKALWIPYFGKKLRNGNASTEETLPYILRHTQMRPRQVVMVCNAIADVSQGAGIFPTFFQNTIVTGVRATEVDLALEIINSYTGTYPKIGQILDALVSMDVLFQTSDLDRVAPATASQWPSGEYSSAKFRQILAEMGILGRVRNIDAKSKIVSADFEYAIKDRLMLSNKEKCVIHPMFMKKFNIRNPEKYKVYPFRESSSVAAELAEQ